MYWCSICPPSCPVLVDERDRQHVDDFISAVASSSPIDRVGYFWTTACCVWRVKLRPRGGSVRCRPSAIFGVCPREVPSKGFWLKRPGALSTEVLLFTGPVAPWTGLAIL